MTNIAIAATSPSAADPAVQLRRAIVASTIGTMIEWYDFYIYTIATGLVFAKLFFPESDPLTGTLQAFGVYAVGFISRPIGAAIFGHYGDRIGRKSTLIATLMLMGIATFLVALVPTYDSIGVWGAVILTLLRFMQGVGVGGEWGGSVLLSMEWCKSDGDRGFVAAWPQWGAPAGFLLATLAVLGFSRISGDGFLAWGWRLPFLFSLLLVIVGLYIRLGILETPIFAKLVAEKKIERTPILQVITTQPKEILLCALVRVGQMAPTYVFTTFILFYGTEILRVPRDFLLTAMLFSYAVSCVSVPVFGYVSDRIGRRKMYVIGATAMGVFGFIYFGLLNTGSLLLIFVATVLVGLPHDMMWGPQAALIAESFPGRVRYSGASLGFQLASVIAGGPAPLIATWLYGRFQSAYAVAGYILVCVVITIISAAFLTDYTGKDIDRESAQGRF